VSVSVLELAMALATVWVLETAPATGSATYHFPRRILPR
jgi:hypothetical protein